MFLVTNMVSIGSHTLTTLNVAWNVLNTSMEMLNSTPSKKFMSGVKHTQRNMVVRRLGLSMLFIGKQKRWKRNE